MFPTLFVLAARGGEGENVVMQRRGGSDNASRIQTPFQRARVADGMVVVVQVKAS